MLKDMSTAYDEYFSLNTKPGTGSHLVSPPPQISPEKLDEMAL